MEKNSKAKKIVYRESDKMINPPKGYKKPNDNLPDMEKVKKYYANKR